MIKQQIEDDADREIYELKQNHEKELKEEQDANVRLRGEAALVKKKLLVVQKEGEVLKHKVLSNMFKTNCFILILIEFLWSAFCYGHRTYEIQRNYIWFRKRCS